MSLFDEGDGKELKMSSGIKGKVKWKPGDNSHAVGFATTTVRASAEQAMAFIWDTEARAKARHDDLEKAVDERPSAHNMLVYNRKKTPNAVDNRDFLGRTLWRKTGSGFEIVSTPESSERRGTPRKTVRGKMTSTMRIVRVQENVTKLEFVIQPDFGGELPAWFMNRSLGGQLARVTEARDYFQALRHEYDAEDGVAIGNLLLSETREEKHHEKGETRVEARVRALFVKNKGLKEVARKYAWMEVMLASVAANKLRPASDCKVKLCNITEKDSKVIGGALASAILANLTAQAAVDEWILRYPAMGELEREYVRERNERKQS